MIPDLILEKKLIGNRFCFYGFAEKIKRGVTI
ncbi:MAG: hypothetical protein ACD_67C00215G0001, partial [uncultured bacterium]